MKQLLLLLVLLALPLAWADENDHPMSKIIGSDIELTTKGHSIAGKVGNKIIFGDVATTDGHKESWLVMKDDHSVIKTKFSSVEGTFGGVLGDDSKQMNIRFVGLDRETATYHIAFGEKTYKVRVEAEDFRNNHFIRPEYVLELDGQEIRAKMVEGQACYMFSLHLIFMIYGSYLF